VYGSLPSRGTVGLSEDKTIGPGLLFVLADGRVLTRQRFVNLVRDGLEKAGVDQFKYCGHSFRIGAATTAAKKGIEDCIIETLERWESLAYLQYVKLPHEQLSGYILGAVSVVTSVEPTVWTHSTKILINFWQLLTRVIVFLCRCVCHIALHCGSRNLGAGAKKKERKKEGRKKKGFVCG